MAVVFQAVGTAATTTTSTLTVAWPTHVYNDVALMFVTSSAGGTTQTLTTANGFALINTFSTGSGTTGTKLSVYWARATSAAMASPILTAGTDFKYGVILTFRGAISNGSPINTSAGAVQATASTSASISAVTTTLANTLIVNAISNDVGSTSAFVTSFTNANLTGLTKQFDSGTIDGSGGGIAVATGSLASAASSGITTAAIASSITAFMTIALTPEPTSIANTFEGGTAGVSISAANSGGASGTPVSSTPFNAPTTLTYNDVQKRGNLSMRISYGTGAGYAVWTWSSNSRFVVRFYLYYEDTVPTEYMEIMQCRSTTNANMGWMATNGRQLIYYNATGIITANNLSAYQLQPNSWYRVEFAVTPGTTTSNGRVEGVFYDGDSTVPIESYDSGATVNTGTVGLAAIRIGSTGGPAAARSIYYDDFSAAQLSSGFIGPSQTVPNYVKNQFEPFFY